MKHSQRHPAYVDGCFACKAATVGYDGKHFTRTTTVRTDIDAAKITDHRDGRRDVEVHPKPVAARLSVTSS